MSDVIFECPCGKSSCLGGEVTGDVSCMAGYEGPLCAVCSKGFYFQSVDNTCQICPESQFNVFSVVLIVVSIVLLLLPLLYFILHRLNLIDLMVDFSVVSFVAYFCTVVTSVYGTISSLKKGIMCRS